MLFFDAAAIASLLSLSIFRFSLLTPVAMPLYFSADYYFASDAAKDTPLDMLLTCRCRQDTPHFRLRR